MCAAFAFLCICLFLTPVRMRMCIRTRYDLRIEKERICSKQREYKTKNCHTSYLHLGKEASKVGFLLKSGNFLSDLRVQFEPLLGLECASICHDLKLKKKRFMLKGTNMIEANGIHVTFMLEIKIQKYLFDKF